MELKDIDSKHRIYAEYFSLGYLKSDIGTKFALIALICHLTHKVKQKRPELNCYRVIKQLCGNRFDEKFIEGLSVVCEDFLYGCTEFPTFGIEDKKIPDKIKEILATQTPF